MRLIGMWAAPLAILFSVSACYSQSPSPQNKDLTSSSKPTGIDDSKLPEAPTRVPLALSPAAKRQIEGYNSLALDLYKSTASEAGDRFFAPASIAAVLSMAQAGAAGTTATEFQAALGNDGTKGAITAQGELLRKIDYHVRGRTLRTRTALWIDQSVKLNPIFQSQIRTAYKAEINRADFRNNSAEALKAINQQAFVNTFGRISNLAGPLDVNKDTKLALFNTVFFRGRWSSEFSKRATEEKPFFLDNGSKVDVSMMSQKDDFQYYKGSGFQMLSMPYFGGETEMLVLLPDEKGGLSALEKQISSQSLAQWLNDMDAGYRPKVILSFPKFTMRQRQYFQKPLVQLGLKTAFDYQKADFSNMIVKNSSDPIYLSKIIHEAVIEVDEEGTVAAAATLAVGFATAAAPRPEEPIIFNADHPFLFLIRDVRSGLILFIGRFSGSGLETTR